MQNNQLHTDDSRQWRAFQYVNGELSAEESESVEQQMVQDADLCTDVAEASLLTSAIAASPQTAPLRQRLPDAPVRSVLNRLAAVVSAVCCCAGVVILLSQQTRTTNTASRKMLETSNAGFLVTAWIDSGETYSEPNATAPEPSDDPDLDIPDWMLAGLSEIHQGEANEAEPQELL